jgi:hypothetical protein
MEGDRQEPALTAGLDACGDVEEGRATARAQQHDAPLALGHEAAPSIAGRSCEVGRLVEAPDAQQPHARGGRARPRLALADRGAAALAAPVASLVAGRRAGGHRERQRRAEGGDGDGSLHAAQYGDDCVNAG